MNFKDHERFPFAQKLKLFTAAGLACLTLACSEEPKEELKDLGEPADFEKIEQALGDALDGSSIHVARIGQYVHYESNYRVDLNPVIKMADIARELLKIEDSPTERKYTLFEDIITYTTSGAIDERKTSEPVLIYKKTPPPAATLKAMTAEGDGCGEEKTAEVKYDCVAYYNFKTYFVDEPAPALTQERPNCGNVPNCKLPARIVEFDRVKFYQGKPVQKEILKLSLSKTIPMLYPDLDFFPMNYFCIAKIYALSGGSYYVNECTVLRDLQL